MSRIAAAVDVRVRVIAAALRVVAAEWSLNDHPSADSSMNLDHAQDLLDEALDDYSEARQAHLDS